MFLLSFVFFDYQKLASHLHHLRRSRHPSREATSPPAFKPPKRQVPYVPFLLPCCFWCMLSETRIRSKILIKHYSPAKSPAYPQHLSFAQHHPPSNTLQLPSPARSPSPLPSACPQPQTSSPRSQRRLRIRCRHAGRGKMRACSVSTARRWRIRTRSASNGSQQRTIQSTQELGQERERGRDKGTGRQALGWRSDAPRVTSSSAAILLPPQPPVTRLMAKPDSHEATHCPKAKVILVPTHVRSHRTGLLRPILVTWPRGSRSLPVTVISSSLIRCSHLLAHWISSWESLTVQRSRRRRMCQSWYRSQ